MAYAKVGYNTELSSSTETSLIARPVVTIYPEGYFFWKKGHDGEDVAPVNAFTWTLSFYLPDVRRLNDEETNKYDQHESNKTLKVGPHVELMFICKANKKEQYRALM